MAVLEERNGDVVVAVVDLVGGVLCWVDEESSSKARFRGVSLHLRHFAV